VRNTRLFLDPRALRSWAMHLTKAREGLWLVKAIHEESATVDLLKVSDGSISIEVFPSRLDPDFLLLKGEMGGSEPFDIER